MNVSKFTFTFLLVIMTYGISSGQYGLRVGANLANLKITNESPLSSFFATSSDKLCGHIGAYYREEINDKFSIRPNLLITAGGSNLTSSFTMGLASVSTIYLGLPLDFMFHIPVGENTLSLVGGPFVGYLLSYSSEVSDEEDEFKNVDYGLNLGLHFQFKSFGIGFSYGIGLANVARESEFPNQLFGETNVNTRAFSLFFTHDL